MKNGFTLIEILVVLSLTTALAMLTIPTGIRFFQTQTLGEAASDIVAALRRAQAQALFQKNDSAFGIKFLSGSYVVFQGASYAARTTAEDETITLPSSVATSGIDEIVFAKFTGIPSPAGTLTVTSGGDSKTVTINASGTIEL